MLIPCGCDTIGRHLVLGRSVDTRKAADDVVLGRGERRWDRAASDFGERTTRECTIRCKSDRHFRSVDPIYCAPASSRETWRAEDVIVVGSLAQKCLQRAVTRSSNSSARARQYSSSVPRLPPRCKPAMPSAASLRPSDRRKAPYRRRPNAVVNSGCAALHHARPSVCLGSKPGRRRTSAARTPLLAMPRRIARTRAPSARSSVGRRLIQRTRCATRSRQQQMPARGLSEEP